MSFVRFLPLFVFPLLLCAASNIGTLKTGQTTVYQANDDGTYQKGQARSFTRDGVNGIVTDNVTGLMWQDDAVSAQVDWTTASGTTCQALNTGGYTDWRLPTVQELSTLVDASRSSPSIDPTFQNTASGEYWSSTAYAPDTANAWNVRFSYGIVGLNAKTFSFYVRCVRGDSYPVSSFSRSGNIVTDSATGLQWQDNTAAASTTAAWSTAITTCEALSLDGYTDWRLPNRNELQSIVDYSDASVPLIDGAFQNTASVSYWSSTTYAPNTASAWGVNFSNGNVYYYAKTNTYYVRCVRGEFGTSGTTAAPIGPFGLLVLLVGILGFGGWSIRKR